MTCDINILLSLNVDAELGQHLALALDLYLFLYLYLYLCFKLFQDQIEQSIFLISYYSLKFWRTLNIWDIFDAAECKSAHSNKFKLINNALQLYIKTITLRFK